MKREMSRCCGIKKKKKENMHTDRCGNIRGQKCAKGSGKEAKIHEFMHGGTTSVDHEMYDYTGTNWSHWNSDKRFKEKFESHARNRFNRFTSKDSYRWNITHNTVSTAV